VTVGIQSAAMGMKVRRCFIKLTDIGIIREEVFFKISMMCRGVETIVSRKGWSQSSEFESVEPEDQS
jgi:hypothetical protein